MKNKIKDIATRAIKTFIQGFIAALPVTLSVAQLSNAAVIKSLLIGAIAGGVSAVWNALYNVANSYIKKYRQN